MQLINLSVSTVFFYATLLHNGCAINLPEWRALDLTADKSSKEPSLLFWSPSITLISTFLTPCLQIFPRNPFPPSNLLCWCHNVGLLFFGAPSSFLLQRFSLALTKRNGVGVEQKPKGWGRLKTIPAPWACPRRVYVWAQFRALPSKRSCIFIQAVKRRDKR